MNRKPKRRGAPQFPFVENTDNASSASLSDASDQESSIDIFTPFNQKYRHPFDLSEQELIEIRQSLFIAQEVIPVYGSNSYAKSFVTKLIPVTPRHLKEVLISKYHLSPSGIESLIQSVEVESMSKSLLMRVRDSRDDRGGFESNNQLISWPSFLDALIREGNFRLLRSDAELMGLTGIKIKHVATKVFKEHAAGMTPFTQVNHCCRVSFKDGDAFLTCASDGVVRLWETALSFRLVGEVEISTPITRIEGAAMALVLATNDRERAERLKLRIRERNALVEKFVRQSFSQQKHREELMKSKAVEVNGFKGYSNNGGNKHMKNQINDFGGKEASHNQTKGYEGDNKNIPTRPLSRRRQNELVNPSTILGANLKANDIDSNNANGMSSTLNSTLQSNLRSQNNPISINFLNPTSNSNLNSVCQSPRSANQTSLRNRKENIVLQFNTKAVAANEKKSLNTNSSNDNNTVSPERATSIYIKSAEIQNNSRSKRQTNACSSSANYSELQQGFDNKGYSTDTNAVNAHLFNGNSTNTRRNFQSNNTEESASSFSVGLSVRPKSATVTGLHSLSSSTFFVNEKNINLGLSRPKSASNSTTSRLAVALPVDRKSGRIKSTSNLNNLSPNTSQRFDRAVRGVHRVIKKIMTWVGRKRDIAQHERQILTDITRLNALRRLDQEQDDLIIGVKRRVQALGESLKSFSSYNSNRQDVSKKETSSKDGKGGGFHSGSDAGSNNAVSRKGLKLDSELASVSALTQFVSKVDLNVLNTEIENLEKKNVLMFEGETVKDVMRFLLSGTSIQQGSSHPSSVFRFLPRVILDLPPNRREKVIPVILEVLNKVSRASAGSISVQDSGNSIEARNSQSQKTSSAVVDHNINSSSSIQSITNGNTPWQLQNQPIANMVNAILQKQFPASYSNIASKTKDHSELDSRLTTPRNRNLGTSLNKDLMHSEYAVVSSNVNNNKIKLFSPSHHDSSRTNISENKQGKPCHTSIATHRSTNNDIEYSNYHQSYQNKNNKISKIKMKNSIPSFSSSFDFDNHQQFGLRNLTSAGMLMEVGLDSDILAATVESLNQLQLQKEQLRNQIERGRMSIISNNKLDAATNNNNLSSIHTKSIFNRSCFHLTPDFREEFSYESEESELNNDYNLLPTSKQRSSHLHSTGYAILNRPSQPTRPSSAIMHMRPSHASRVKNGLSSIAAISRNNIRAELTSRIFSKIANRENSRNDATVALNPKNLSSSPHQAKAKNASTMSPSLHILSPSEKRAHESQIAILDKILSSGFQGVSINDEKHVNDLHQSSKVQTESIGESSPNSHHNNKLDFTFSTINVNDSSGGHETPSQANQNYHGNTKKSVTFGAFWQKAKTKDSFFERSKISPQSDNEIADEISSDLSSNASFNLADDNDKDKFNEEFKSNSLINENPSLHSNNDEGDEIENSKINPILDEIRSVSAWESDSDDSEVKAILKQARKSSMLPKPSATPLEIQKLKETLGEFSVSAESKSPNLDVVDSFDNEDKDFKTFEYKKFSTNSSDFCLTKGDANDSMLASISFVNDGITKGNDHQHMYHVDLNTNGKSNFTGSPRINVLANSQEMNKVNHMIFGMPGSAFQERNYITWQKEKQIYSDLLEQIHQDSDNDANKQKINKTITFSHNDAQNPYSVCPSPSIKEFLKQNSETILNLEPILESELNSIHFPLNNNNNINNFQNGRSPSSPNALSSHPFIQSTSSPVLRQVRSPQPPPLSNKVSSNIEVRYKMEFESLVKETTTIMSSNQPINTPKNNNITHLAVAIPSLDITEISNRSIAANGYAFPSPDPFNSLNNNNGNTLKYPSLFDSERNLETPHNPSKSTPGQNDSVKSTASNLSVFTPHVPHQLPPAHPVLTPSAHLKRRMSRLRAVSSRLSSSELSPLSMIPLSISDALKFQEAAEAQRIIRASRLSINSNNNYNSSDAATGESENKDNSNVELLDRRKRPSGESSFEKATNHQSVSTTENLRSAGAANFYRELDLAMTRQGIPGAIGLSPAIATARPKAFVTAVASDQSSQHVILGLGNGSLCIFRSTVLQGSFETILHQIHSFSAKSFVVSDHPSLPLNSELSDSKNTKSLLTEDEQQQQQQQHSKEPSTNFGSYRNVSRRSVASSYAGGALGAGAKSQTKGRPSQGVVLRSKRAAKSEFSKEAMVLSCVPNFILLPSVGMREEIEKYYSPSQTTMHHLSSPPFPLSTITKSPPQSRSAGKTESVPSAPDYYFVGFKTGRVAKFSIPSPSSIRLHPVEYLSALDSLMKLPLTQTDRGEEPLLAEHLYLHNTSITSLLLIPKFGLISIASDGAIANIDVRTFKVHWRLPSPANWIGHLSCACISNLHNLIATGSNVGSLELIDLTSRSRIQSNVSSNSNTSSNSKNTTISNPSADSSPSILVSFAGDTQNAILYLQESGSLSIWSSGTFVCLYSVVLPGLGGPVTSAFFDQMSMRLMIFAKVVSFWDVLEFAGVRCVDRALVDSNPRRAAHSNHSPIKKSPVKMHDTSPSSASNILPFRSSHSSVDDEKQKQYQVTAPSQPPSRLPPPRLLRTPGSAAFAALAAGNIKSPEDLSSLVALRGSSLLRQTTRNFSAIYPPLDHPTAASIASLAKRDAIVEFYQQGKNGSADKKNRDEANCMSRDGHLVILDGVSPRDPPYSFKPLSLSSFRASLLFVGAVGAGINSKVFTLDSNGIGTIFETRSGRMLSSVMLGRGVSDMVTLLGDDTVPFILSIPSSGSLRSIWVGANTFLNVSNLVTGQLMCSLQLPTSNKQTFEHSLSSVPANSAESVEFAGGATSFSNEQLLAPFEEWAGIQSSRLLQALGASTDPAVALEHIGLSTANGGTSSGSDGKGTASEVKALCMEILSLRGSALQKADEEGPLLIGLSNGQLLLLPKEAFSGESGDGQTVRNIEDATQGRGGWKVFLMHKHPLTVIASMEGYAVTGDESGLIVIWNLASAGDTIEPVSVTSTIFLCTPTSKQTAIERISSPSKSSSDPNSKYALENSYPSNTARALVPSDLAPQCMHLFRPASHKVHFNHLKNYPPSVLVLTKGGSLVAFNPPPPVRTVRSGAACTANSGGHVSSISQSAQAAAKAAVIWQRHPTVALSQVLASASMHTHQITSLTLLQASTKSLSSAPFNAKWTWDVSRSQCLMFVPDFSYVSLWQGPDPSLICIRKKSITAPWNLSQNSLVVNANQFVNMSSSPTNFNQQQQHGTETSENISAACYAARTCLGEGGIAWVSSIPRSGLWLIGWREGWVSLINSNLDTIGVLAAPQEGPLSGPLFDHKAVNDFVVNYKKSAMRSIVLSHVKKLTMKEKAVDAFLSNFISKKKD